MTSSTRSRALQGTYFIVVGVAFAAYGVILLNGPTYWNPATVLDHASIWTYSLAYVLAGPAFVVLVRQAEGGAGARALAWFLAVAAVLTGVANAIEDGFGQDAFGTLYLVGVTSFFLGQIVLAILLAIGDRRRYALVPLLTFAGSLAFNQGGPMVIGATWVAFGVLVLTGRAAGRDPERRGALSGKTR